MGDIMHLVWTLVIGGVAGWLAGMIMGRNSNILMNIIVGLVGGLIGGIIFWLIPGISADENLIGRLITAVVGAVVLLWLIGSRKK